MRSLLTLLACLMLVVTAWSGAAQAAGIGCVDMAAQTALHIAGDCDEVPADADRGYPHCHTGCHGHHVAATVVDQTPDPVGSAALAFAAAGTIAMAGRCNDQHMRPPRA